MFNSWGQDQRNIYIMKLVYTNEQNKVDNLPTFLVSESRSLYMRTNQDFRENEYTCIHTDEPRRRVGVHVGMKISDNESLLNMKPLEGKAVLTQSPTRNDRYPFLWVDDKGQYCICLGVCNDYYLTGENVGKWVHAVSHDWASEPWNRSLEISLENENEERSI